jgi:hypothetical protein
MFCSAASSQTVWGETMFHTHTIQQLRLYAHWGVYSSKGLDCSIGVVTACRVAGDGATSSIHCQSRCECRMWWSCCCFILYKMISSTLTQSVYCLNVCYRTTISGAPNCLIKENLFLPPARKFDCRRIGVVHSNTLKYTDVEWALWHDAHPKHHEKPPVG